MFQPTYECKIVFKFYWEVLEILPEVKSSQAHSRTESHLVMDIRI